jgi:transcriptional regulator with XRE-family HTH domain
VRRSLGTDWGATIKARREQFGLSQAALGKRCGVTQQAIAKFESGTQIPLDRTKVAIARALCSEVGDLFPWPSLQDIPNEDAA